MGVLRNVTADSPAIDFRNMLDLNVLSILVSVNFFGCLIRFINMNLSQLFYSNVDTVPISCGCVNSPCVLKVENPTNRTTSFINNE